MATDNHELMRELYASPSAAKFRAALHPDAELHQAREIPDSDDYYGRDEFVRGLERWFEGWEAFRFVPEEFSDHGERLLLQVHLIGQARASGVALDQLVWHVWQFQEGLPWRCDVFFDRDAAVAFAAEG